MATYVTYSETGICNLALSRIGAVSGISSLDTTVDTSTEAAACLLWYPQTRDRIITEWPWPWAQTSFELDQVNTLYPATPQYQYSYRYPSDCLQARFIRETITQGSQTVPPQTTGISSVLSGLDQWWLRPEGIAQPWGFRIESDDVGRLILTDLQNATLLYTRQVVDPTQFAPDFISLLAWELAEELSMELAVSDQRRKMAQAGTKREKMKTRGRFANERQSDIPVRWPNSEFVRSRWGW